MEKDQDQKQQNQQGDKFFRRLKANGVKIVTANSVMRDMVDGGEVKVASRTATTSAWHSPASSR